MFNALPQNVHSFMEWPWSKMAPYFEDLEQRPLTAESIDNWLSDWSRLLRLIQERSARLNLATTQDTADEGAERKRNHFLETVHPEVQRAEQKLKEKLLQSGLEPEGMGVPIQKMRTDAALFRDANIPLLVEETKLGAEYNKIAGAQMVVWQGEPKTLIQLRSLMQTEDRGVREQIWRLMAERQLEDRPALNTLWGELLRIRSQLAANAGFDDYLSYRWQFLKRYDYTPADNRAFHEAIETVVVPAAGRIYEQLKQALGVERLRPWDVKMDVYPMQLPVLRPVTALNELDDKAAVIFSQVDANIGEYFALMRSQDLLDLNNRPGKAPGAYCTYFATAKRPFIFMNAVGTADDVKTLLHEAGHAFHGFEANGLPYVHQRRTGAEFAEVASMSMELLGAPFLTADKGGYYQSNTDANQFRIDHLRKIITFWPYMAVVDGFQHWAYQNLEAAADPAQCDAKWAELWQRFIPGIDWEGVEDVMMTGWHRKLHIFRIPLYYVEYGMAQVGAIQVWQNSLRDRVGAVTKYRQALALGGTRSLPELYAAAGARFQFDTSTMRDLVKLLEREIATLQNGR